MIAGAPVVGIEVLKKLDDVSIKDIHTRIMSIFGTHDGPAACKLMCVAIPSNATVDHVDACVVDGYGTKCGLARGNGDIYPDYFGGVSGGVEKVVDNVKLVCTMAMNWSHDRNRTIRWRVTW
jgi:hypothetical protein